MLSTTSRPDLSTGDVNVQGLPLRLLLSFSGVAIVTFIGYRLIPVNATTVGFAYLLFILLIASTWGFIEASLSSILATLLFNCFFLPPIGTLTIADPQNWVALFSFLATSLIASRLSEKAKRRALEASERREDIERLYTFSRAILLIDRTQSFPKQLLDKVAEIFHVSAALLYECRTGEFSRAGPSDFAGLDEQVRDAALHGTTFFDPQRHRTITAIRLGSEPIASLALQGAEMPESVVQGIANLVAIGLERARAQELAQQIEAARQSEQLRTTLIDAMAHEFKTPLTLIIGATTSLLANPNEPENIRMEQLTMAGEEAEHLRELIDSAIELARLDTTHIEVNLEMSNVEDIVREVVSSMHTEMEERSLELECDAGLPAIPVDRRLLRLAIKQLADNALKYSPADTPVAIRLRRADGGVAIEITDHGGGIPVAEQKRVFERFYRSPSVKHQIPGSGLGLSIAYSIMQAHKGDLAVTSRPGETTFQMILPANHQGEHI